MSITNTLRGIARSSLRSLGLRVQRLEPNQIRGIDPIADIKYLLAGRRSPTIFDVGANDGETSEAFFEAFPGATIVAFEPFLACAEKLSARFSSRPAVRVENVALGEQSGEGQLNVFSGNRMNSLLELSSDPANLMKGFKKTGVSPVQVDTLDSYCTRHAISSLDVLKVDTQGYDLNVLKGGRSLLSAKRVKVVLLEVNFIPMYSKQASFIELHTFLSAYGYQLVAFYNHVWQNGHTAWCDGCYVAPESSNQ